MTEFSFDIKKILYNPLARHHGVKLNIKWWIFIPYVSDFLPLAQHKLILLVCASLQKKHHIITSHKTLERFEVGSTLRHFFIIWILHVTWIILMMDAWAFGASTFWLAYKMMKLRHFYMKSFILNLFVFSWRWQVWWHDIFSMTLAPLNASLHILMCTKKSGAYIISPRVL